jgi:hypothetical protein
MPEIEIPEIRDIAPPLPPDTAWPLYIWLAIALGAVLIVVALILLIKKSKTLPAPAAVYDARQSALTKLHDLKEGYLELPAPEFALQASFGLREYLTSRYGTTTPFETGSEFLDRQVLNQLMGEDKHLAVRQLYRRAETLKYAPAPDADSQRLELVQDMITFVRDDVPGPQLKPAAPASDADSIPA